MDLYPVHPVENGLYIPIARSCPVKSSDTNTEHAF